MLDDFNIVPAPFRRIRYVISQSFDIGADSRKRRADVVGHAGNEFLSVFFLPRPLLQGLFQFFRHDIERIDDRLHFIIVAVGQAVREIALPHLIRSGLQQFESL